MQKERAASALAHGLPVPTPPAARTRSSSESSSSRPPSSAPPLSSSNSGPPGRRTPLAVKLLAAGVGLLGALYGLTLLRDHKDTAAHAPVVPESQAALVSPSVAPVPASVDAPASAAMTSPSSPVAEASASASASAGTIPSIAKRMKGVLGALHGHKPPGAQPDTSAVQPNLAAALVPAAPAHSAVK